MQSLRRHTGSRHWPGIRTGTKVIKKQLKPSLKKSMKPMKCFLMRRKKPPTTSMVMRLSNRADLEMLLVKVHSPPKADQPLAGAVRDRSLIPIPRVAVKASIFPILDLVIHLKFLNNFLAEAPRLLAVDDKCANKFILSK